MDRHLIFTSLLLGCLLNWTRLVLPRQKPCQVTKTQWEKVTLVKGEKECNAHVLGNMILDAPPQ